MIARAKLWFMTLSQREKWLILGALALFGVVLVWLVVLPIDDALSAARQRHADAVVRLAETRGQIDAIKRARRGGGVLPGPLDAIIRERAQAGGLALESVVPEGNRLRIHIASAKGGALLGWLGELEASGVLVDRLDITNNGDQSVAADITLRARMQ